MIKGLFKGIKNVECTGEKDYLIDGVNMTLQSARIHEIDSNRWNALAEKQNTKMFIQLVGREPRNYEEVRKWINSTIEPKKKAVALTTTFNQ